MKKILFILKYRESDYDGGSYTNEKQTWAFKKGLSSGLLNSASFVNNMLNTVKGFQSKLVQVTDNNDIDREVTAYKPDIVIIEAYWVVPEKFDVLTKLHPKVKWIIRNHSNTPFLANEGIAFGWSLDYLDKPNVYLSCNHKKSLNDLRYLVKQVYPHTPECKINHRVNYLPNYYPTKFDYVMPKIKKSKNILDVGCFGAIRPLKNHMIQAIAAIQYAAKTGKYLRFHINGNRIEGKGEPILKNLRETFARTKNAELVEHTWLQHEDFVKLVYSMDIGLQVSFTETFNIVAADFIVNNVPIVASKEIDWTNPLLYAEPTNIDSIINAIDAALYIKKCFSWINPHMRGLEKYDAASKKQWVKILNEL